MFPKLRSASCSSRGNWKIEDTQLKEHVGLIPIEMLARHFAVLDLNDDHQGKFNRTTCGPDARKHPVHTHRVCKTDNQLIHNPIVAEDLRNITKFEIRWDVW